MADYNIRVNYSQLKAAADAIDNYVRLMKAKMKSADSEVQNLSWQGEDYNVFKQKWNGVFDNGSVYTNMVKLLESYSGYLKYAQNQYRAAQIRAVNRANWLR